MISSSVIGKCFLIVPVLGGLCACGDNGGDAITVVDAAELDAPATAPPGITMFNFDIAVDLTPDGATAVFEELDEVGAHLFLVDTASGAATDHGLVGDPARVLVTGISAGGRVTGFRGEPVEAALWSEAGGWVGLGSNQAAGCDQDRSSAWDVSADGHTVIGLDWNGCAATAMRWSDAGGTGTFTPLDVLGPSSRATVISDDGAVAGGFAQVGQLDRVPALWNAAGDGTLLEPENTDAPGEILALSADGAVAAGIRGNDGFVWTAAGGVQPMVRFDGPLPSDPVFPNATSGDGRLVFGGVGSAFFTIPVAFVWTEAAGMRPLADVVRAAGIDLPATTVLNNVLAASVDGTVLIGIATENDVALRTFVLRLPAGAL